MKVIDPGHVYELFELDKPRDESGTRIAVPPQRLIFVKREGCRYPGNVGHHRGTNLQDVLRCCIDRVTYLESQISHTFNPQIISRLVECIVLLERRAAQIHGRRWTNINEVEKEPFCQHCGHVGCKGDH